MKYTGENPNLDLNEIVACEGVMLGTVSTYYDVDAVLIAVSAS